MVSLEDRLRPRFSARPWPRDSLALGLLVVLAAILLPIYARGAGKGLIGPGEIQQDSTLASYQIFYLNNVAGQMASSYMLLAMGFALALRCGAIDLSVWMAASLGGLVAAWTINAGLSPLFAFAAAILAGSAIGCLNGLLVGLLRLPSVLVTAAAAGGTMWLMQAATGWHDVVVPSRAFRGLDVLPFDPPLLIGRMLIVVAAYSVVMLLLVWAEGAANKGRTLPRRWELFCSLGLSGALAGIAGACWLIDYNVAAAPAIPIGDLRVPAAAVLAGSALLGGRARTIIVAVALPPAVLTATVWRQAVWSLPFHGLDLQIVLLLGEMLIINMAILHAVSWRHDRRFLPATALAATSGGLVLLAGSAWVATPAEGGLFRILAIGVFMIGAVLLIISRSRSSKTFPSAGGSSLLRRSP